MTLIEADDAPIDRLERTYTHIFIDEVQDLVGWDLEILDRLLRSRARVHVVGDLRQSILETNPHDTKNKQYRGVEMLKWFRAREGKTLTIRHQTETHRCNQAIADLGDRVFGEQHGFKPTTSLQAVRTDHDGVFAVEPDHVSQYVDCYAPCCLRYSSASAKQHALEFRNFGEAKGLTFDRVLIAPTKSIEKFLAANEALAGRSACAFYVGVTRAKHSVALVLSKAAAKKASIQLWTPAGRSP